VTLTHLVRQALRMRPDRLVVGEVRGAELADLLSALNTGHEGGCGTVHANSAGDVPARLEALAALGGLGRDALHAQLAAALQVLVHVRRLSDGRRWVDELRLVRPDPVTGRCRAVPAVHFRPGAADERGEGYAELCRIIGGGS
jgi:pilus assembly protein CpaF